MLAFPVKVELFKATLILTNDQIKALPTTPVRIVAAPGVGKMIVPIWAVFSCDCTAGSYSNFNTSATVSANPFASSVYLALDAANNFNDATGPVPAGQSDGSGGLLNGGEHRVALANGVGDGLIGVGPAASPSYDLGIPTNVVIGFDNSDLSVVGQNNGLGNFQGGHAANSMKVTVVYTIADL